MVISFEHKVKGQKVL